MTGVQTCALPISRYQTVFANVGGAIAAPTAGLHFTPEILNEIPHAFVTLHVGPGTFLPVRAEKVTEHRMHAERFSVSREAADKINSARRVLAVGTTVVRALESIADENGRVQEAHDYTQLKIDNHHQLKAIDGLLTGLHEPEASHLDLLSAFVPAEKIRSAYEEAIAKKYLWHEFGDLNLIL